MSAPSDKSGKLLASAKLHIYDSDSSVAARVAQFLVESANKSILSNGLFTVGVSGGSLAKFLCNELPKLTTDWSKWRVFFCDERHVPYDHPECTYKFYKDNLMIKVPLQPEHIFPDNPDIDVNAAASEYTEKLKTVFGDEGIPQFDMLLLGMGPDGHTCSLFPGHPLLEEKEKLVAAISDSPKPPPERITLTFPVINNTKCAVFVSCGAGKAEIVQKVLEELENPPLPASRVRPNEGELHWFLDEGAARLIKTKASI